MRIILLPGLILGLCGYLLVNASESEYTGNIPYVNFVPVITLLVTFGHAYSFNTTMVLDKASNMKSLMISMGLTRMSYYIAYLICMLTCLLPLTVTIAIFSINYVYIDTQASDISIILMFILFSIQFTGVVFAVSSFITSTSFVAVMGLLLFLEGGLNSLVIALCTRVPNWQYPIVFVSSISPFQSIRLFSSSYVLCKNCDKIQSQDSLISYPTHHILIAELFWTLALFAFARWFDEVCPWQTDSATQGPCFCLNCLPSYQNSDEPTQDPRQTCRFFEQRTRNPEEGISLYHLKKSFNKVTVVNDLSFKIYKYETTLLLGHNGAGKTTLMSMILGKLKPDSGFVRTRKQQEIGAGLCIGYCPQKSILDENLTVLQHVELFHDLKSSFDTNRRANIHTTLDDVSLAVHANKLPSELSGGMKRKLSLAMAFVGNSSILILDEPSSGLDPDSRVYIWNAIRRYRSNRTVLLSTQHMEEADYLGDRIAIMSGGKIVCCGSSLFLNQLFGAGYKLRIECLASDKSVVMDMIKRRFSRARMFSGESSRATDRDLQARPGDLQEDFVVELIDEPSSDCELKLISLLKDLEKSSAGLVRSFGLKSSSIEDVMLNTSEYFKQQVEDRDHSSLTLETISESIKKMMNPQRLAVGVSKSQRYRMQLYSLIVKNLRTYRTNWISTVLYRLVLPILSAYWNVGNLNASLYNVFSNPTSSLNNIFCFMYFIYIPVLERATKFKIMQLTSNTNYVIYWISHLITDILTILIATLSYSIFIAVYFEGEFAVSTTSFYLLATTSFVIFGLASATFCYFMSMLFDSAQSGLSTILVLNGASFFAQTFISLLKLTIGSKVNLNWLSPLVTYLFTTFLPVDAYSTILGGFVDECYIKGSTGCKPTLGTSDVVTRKVWFGMAALVLQIILYGVSLYLVESKILDMGYYWRQIPYLWRSKPKVAPVKIIDEDVLQESKKASLVLQQEHTPSISLIASDVSRSYISGVRVVEGLSLTVQRGECFGLLGVNGAGKSTTFSMIASEFRPDSGRIRAQGVFSDKDVTLYRHKISYDPQSNPTIPLSVYESLHLIATLRDIDQTSIPGLITSLVRLLDMEPHIWKKAADLSGGTLRKLALGMALLGNPNLLLLDEPTAGIDPVARHGIWTLLRSVRQQNNSIVISSHAMEECEAICNRISIMAQGRLRCIGSFLHLRQKFAQGYTIRVQFKENVENSQSSRGTGSLSTVLTNLKQQLEQRIGQSAKMVDSSINSATFNIIDKHVKRSKLFEEMRTIRQKYPDLSYIINDSSLEDIFIKLAREQQELEDQTRVR